MFLTSRAEQIVDQMIDRPIRDYIAKSVWEPILFATTRRKQLMLLGIQTAHLVSYLDAVLQIPIDFSLRRFDFEVLNDETKS